MKNINLLPKVPRINQIFLPALVASAVFFAGTAGALLAWHLHLTSSSTGIQQSIALENATLSRLVKQKAADPLTKQYEELNKQVAQLKKQSRDWLPFFDVMTSNLPADARLVSASMEQPKSPEQQALAGSGQAAPAGQAQTGTAAAQTKDAGTVKLSLEFARLEDAAEYMIRLQQSGAAAKVTVKSADRVERSKVEAPAADAATQGILSTGSAAGAGTQSFDKENYTQSLESQLPPASNESQALLNQLSWAIQQKFASGTLGFDLPDKTFTAPANGNLDPNIATDYEQEKANLERMKKSIADSKKTGASTVAPAAATKLVVYKVELELNLANSNQEK